VAHPRFGLDLLRTSWNQLPQESVGLEVRRRIHKGRQYRQGRMLES